MISKWAVALLALPILVTFSYAQENPDTPAMWNPQLPAALPTAKLVIPADTPIVLRANEGVSDKTARAGDEVWFSAAKDVVIEGRVVIPASAKARAVIVEIRKPRRRGKPGALVLKFVSIELITGETVPLAAALSETGQEKNMTVEMLRGIEKAHEVGGSGYGAGITEILVTPFTPLVLLKHGEAAQIGPGTIRTVNLPNTNEVDAASVSAANEELALRRAAWRAALGEDGLLYIYLTGGIPEHGRIKLFVDDRQLARISPGHFLAVRLPAGNHVVRCRQWGCSRREFDLKSGSLRFIKVEIRGDLFRRTDLNEVAEDIAIEEIAWLRPYEEAGRKHQTSFVFETKWPEPPLPVTTTHAGPN